MSAPTYKINTYGQTIVVATGYDLTGNTSLKVHMRKPDSGGTVVTKTAVVYGTITEGKVAYTVETGVLDTLGEWRIEAEVEKGASVKVRSSSSGRFVVTNPFEN